MSTTGAKSKSTQQELVLSLFNQVVQPKRDFNSLTPLEKMGAIYSSLDHAHELNESIRVKLQVELERIRPNEFDPNQILTDGPLKGSTIAWVSAYIAASECSFPAAARANSQGYPYFLSRIINLAPFSVLDLSVSFKATQLKVSALWLSIFADIRELRNNSDWFTENLLKKLNSEQLRKLDVNAMGFTDNGIACSVLALLIKQDYLSRHSPDYVHELLNKVPPLDHPTFYNFNKNVLDKANFGMTTLCFAGQMEADLVKKDKTVSHKSAFLAIVEATKTNIHTLDFNARIRAGKNKGKSALWYAAYAGTGQIYDTFDMIVENADLDRLDFNAKAEDPNDDDANSSVLWLASFSLVNYRHGHPLLTILRKRTDLSTLDFNNCPTTDKDGDKGKTVLWQCALAALNGMKGDDEALLIILNSSARLKLDYSAKAESGDYANHSVSDLIIQLAKEGNVMPLIKMLQDPNRSPLIEQQITPLLFASMCAKLIELSLDDTQFLDFISLYGILLSLHLSAAHLNEIVPFGECKGQTVLMQLLELALFGYPQLLDKAFKVVNPSLIGEKHLISPTLGMLVKLKKMCHIATVFDHDTEPLGTLSWFLSDRGCIQEDHKIANIDALPQAESILSGYLSDRSSAQDYFGITDDVNALLVKFRELKLQSDEEQKQSIDATLKFTRGRWG